jgi:Rps23 Pro-64 3,4-dihydroxylase Tpa1-like proline 4-hydroxylase
MNPFFFEPEKLRSLAERHREGYASAAPFAHAVFDELVPSAALEPILAEFPAPKAVPWLEHTHRHSRKLATNDESWMGPATRQFLAQLNASTFIDFLERLTRIEGLIPDPHFYGGGLHQIEPGGRLEIHADFNWYKRLRLDRRLNVLIYLNRDWDESWGGHLELWERDMSRCARRIAPLFNRWVVFSTTDTSFHGHPEPLRCPVGRTRRSIAAYYYTNGRPGEESSAPHSTLYQARPGASSRPAPRRSLGGRLRRWLSRG